MQGRLVLGTHPRYFKSADYVYAIEPREMVRKLYKIEGSRTGHRKIDDPVVSIVAKLSLLLLG